MAMRASTVLAVVCMAQTAYGWPGHLICREPGRVTECTALIGRVLAEVQQASAWIDAGEYSSEIIERIKGPELDRMRCMSPLPDE